MQKAQLTDQKFILFWLGVLTGAIVVALIFTYQAINLDNISDALLHLYEKSKDLSITGSDTKMTGPDM